MQKGLPLSLLAQVGVDVLSFVFFTRLFFHTFFES